MHNFVIQFSLFFAVSMILVSTGQTPLGWSNKTEIINLEDDSKCQDVEDFPVYTYSPMGAHIIGSFPVVCGGRNNYECYQLKSGKWQPFATLGQRYIY